VDLLLQYEFACNTNGVHLFKFYTYNKQVIKASDYLFLQANHPETRKNLKVISHVGVKQPFKENLSISTLLTTSRTTFFSTKVGL